MNILYLIPYTSLVPPVNGGQLRCFYLLKGFLDQGHRVHLLIRQPAEEITKELKHPNLEISTCTNSFPGSAIKGIPGKIYRALYYRWLRKSLKGPAGIFLIQAAHHVRRILTRTKIDLVILEHLESMMASKYIRSLSPEIHQVLDAHNVDHILYALENSRIEIKGFKALYKRTLWYESHLYKFVDSYFTCSTRDLKVFEQWNHKISGHVVPNGTDTNLKKPDMSAEKFDCKNLLFCGDLNTTANSDGLRWFYDSIWPVIKTRFDEVTLTVVGGGESKPEFDDIRHDNRVFFKGRVDNLAREYFQAGISIAPLRVGSGTRLKILEAMSFGNPVVSTNLGAEGLEFVVNEHILIGDSPDDFANKVLHLLTAKEDFEKLRSCARQLVEEKYDWAGISVQAVKSIEKAKYGDSPR